MATLTVPHDVPSPNVDAEALKTAFKGWGADEKAIISILAHRNWIQRKHIRIAYEQLFQEDLIKRLESEISGHFERAVYRWMLDPEDRDAVLAHIAIRKPKEDFAVLVELSCIYSPEELLGVRRAYQHRYKRSLEEDVAASTNDDLRTLLVGLVSTYRYSGPEVDLSLAKSEAERLERAVRDKTYYHEDVIRILTTRSRAQLVATFNHYKDAYGVTISKQVGTDTAGKEFTEALRTVIRCIDDPIKYYEKVVRNAIKRVGKSDEDALTRVVVSRAEKDLMQIKEAYHKRNSVTLDDAVSKESGDYKRFIHTLLGN
ncbi:annexin-like protein RJ4 [Cucurbita pepo subsp. pepo]|uniref:annexin-like protein RJ4 n=1 Tax=Cucurbita pepo subsp. pepo TaxID=3664 RepID=UPI000C9D3EB8|nr:annexin-like protein RJ4 [Cucurbita pepo subsp. pepo]